MRASAQPARDLRLRPRKSNERLDIARTKTDTKKRSQETTFKCDSFDYFEPGGNVPASNHSPLLARGLDQAPLNCGGCSIEQEAK